MDPAAQIVVGEIGGWNNYALPVVLDKVGMLAHFYTGAYAGKGWLKWAVALLPGFLRPAPVRRLLRRNCDVPASKITSFNWLGIRHVLNRPKGVATCHERTLWAAGAFGRKIACRLDGSADAFYSIPRNSREAFERAKALGMKCIYEQNAAAMEFEAGIMEEEHARWPGWEQPALCGPAYERVLDRLRKERQLADAVICPSRFVQQSMHGKLRHDTKVFVVPYGIDVSQYQAGRSTATPAGRSEPLHVLYLGAVRLQKGPQYLLKAVENLGRSVTVRVVGPVVCNSERLMSAAPPTVVVLGQVAHCGIQPHLQWADVLCLPSLSEGSAAVTYEALAAGMPVICTPNAGSVVRDGVEGYIVPIRNADAIAEKLLVLSRDRELLAEMSRSAAQRANEYTWDRYGERVIKAIIDIIGPR